MNLKKLSKHSCKQQNKWYYHNKISKCGSNKIGCNLGSTGINNKQKFLQQNYWIRLLRVALQRTSTYSESSGGQIQISQEAVRMWSSGWREPGKSHRICVCQCQALEKNSLFSLVFHLYDNKQLLKLFPFLICYFGIGHWP